jgi:hypothetical protein
MNIDAVLSSSYTSGDLRHYAGTLTDIRPKDSIIYYFKDLENTNGKMVTDVRD